MTTEEKAKAYDEALERARKELKQDLHESGIWAIQRIFPDLKESEDERIRKELKEAFEAYDIESTWNGIPIRSIFAWLEKQKDSNDMAFHEGYTYGFEDGMKEQKPVERYLDLTELLVPQRNIGQKLVTDGWSIKDANFHSNLLYLMRENNSKEGWEGCYEWLEELPSRISLEQKPVEWSEEDDQLIGFIFDLLNSLVWRKEWAMDKKECLERLKSLRPSWKPSEK